MTGHGQGIDVTIDRTETGVRVEIFVHLRPHGPEISHSEASSDPAGLSDPDSGNRQEGGEHQASATFGAGPKPDWPRLFADAAVLRALGSPDMAEHMREFEEAYRVRNIMRMRRNKLRRIGDPGLPQAEAEFQAADAALTELRSAIMAQLPGQFGPKDRALGRFSQKRAMQPMRPALHEASAIFAGVFGFEADSGFRSDDPERDEFSALSQVYRRRVDLLKAIGLRLTHSVRLGKHGQAQALESEQERARDDLTEFQRDVLAALVRRYPDLSPYNRRDRAELSRRATEAQRLVREERAFQQQALARLDREEPRTQPDNQVCRPAQPLPAEATRARSRFGFAGPALAAAEPEH